MKAKRPRLEDRIEDAIVYTERDTEGVLAPQNDVVVVTINIADFDVHHIFIDNESLVDILYYSIFSKMRFIPDQLSRFDTSIQSFSKDLVIPEGVIRLLITVDTPPQ